MLENFLSTTTIHFCSAHVIHRFSGNVKEIFTIPKHHFVTQFLVLQLCQTVHRSIKESKYLFALYLLHKQENLNA